MAEPDEGPGRRGSDAAGVSDGWAPDEPPNPPNPAARLSNGDFLSAVFAGAAGEERPIVVCIPGALGAGTAWPTGDGWTPTLPTRDDTANWFFTLSTYLPREGRYRRIKASFHRSFGVMLDDVGTKAEPLSRLEALPPSYVIETSPGNFQVGYLFEEPVADADAVEHLQEALVLAGLCDPGAKGPTTRLGRLPRGRNGKYATRPQCQLMAWHPDRRYSIPTIRQRLGLGDHSPAKASRPRRAADLKARGLPDRPLGTDGAVLLALRARGLYKRLIGEGKHDITCPWVAEHTDAIDSGTAYFEPSEAISTGGFKCQHGHCTDRHIGDLLRFLDVSPAEAKDLPRILVVPGDMARIVDAAERILAATGRFYQRGGVIVVVARDPVSGAHRIRPVSINSLTRALAWSAVWERFSAAKNDLVVIDPPVRHASLLFDADSYAHLPPIAGIAHQPFLRPDGSLVNAAGFDAASRMFGAFDERAFAVPEAPTRADAEAALGRLRRLLTEFRFVDDSDAAATIALFLTAAIRPSLPVAPMGHVRAPEIASGKSYLTTLIAAFASPAAPAAHAFPCNEEECAKLLLSVLMDAPPVVNFDNLTTDLLPYRGLCSALSEPYIAGRLLGASKTAAVPTAALFLSSGNNVDAVKDMTRRALTIRLDTRCEVPAARRFKGDPLAEVRRKRADYVADALTIVRAFVVAGMPPQDAPPLAGYSDWSRLVCGPLMWLGLPNPAAGMLRRVSEDGERDLLGRLLAAWDAEFGGSPTPVRALAERADSTGTGSDLKEVVSEIAEDRGVLNRRRLGRWIARHEGRVVHGRRLIRDRRVSGSEQWRVEVMGD